VLANYIRRNEMKDMVYYSVPDLGESRYIVPGTHVFTDELDYTWAAEAAAENYWYHHDGWDCSWPLIFVLHRTEDGPELGRFFVDVEARPSFSAMREKRKNEKV